MSGRLSHTFLLMRFSALCDSVGFKTLTGHGINEYQDFPVIQVEDVPSTSFFPSSAYMAMTTKGAGLL